MKTETTPNEPTFEPRTNPTDYIILDIPNIPNKKQRYRIPTRKTITTTRLDEFPSIPSKLYNQPITKNPDDNEYFQTSNYDREPTFNLTSFQNYHYKSRYPETWQIFSLTHCTCKHMISLFQFPRQSSSGCFSLPSSSGFVPD
jgi:hypothetical protein